MFLHGLSKDTKSNLAILNESEITSGFYLAGGTACALHLGHRLSFDLDFFSPKDFNSKKLAEKINALGKFGTEQVSPNTLLGQLNKIRISFFTYSYPLLFPLHKYLQIEIADLRDIACMKIDAISSRGTKRDFIDLFFICKQENLEKLLRLFQKKYKGVNYNLFHIIKSLTYFFDAEDDDMPQMIKKVKWQEIKKFFEDEVKKIARKFIK